MQLRIELRKQDVKGQPWRAVVHGLDATVDASSADPQDAVVRAKAAALRHVADGLEGGKFAPGPLHVSFAHL